MLQQTPAATPVPIQISRPAAASDVYVAAKNARKELKNQLEQLEDKRNDLSNSLQNEDMAQAAKPGITARIAELDARISALDQQVAAADQAVAKAAAAPGAVVEPPPYQRSGPPEEVYAIPIVFTVVVLMPIAIAYARRIWKRTGVVVAPVPKEVQSRLDSLSDAVESIGLEVERIGEGQRFVTKVLTESNARVLGHGAAQAIPVPARGEMVGVPRGDAQ